MLHSSTIIVGDINAVMKQRKYFQNISANVFEAEYTPIQVAEQFQMMWFIHFK